MQKQVQVNPNDNDVELRDAIKELPLNERVKAIALNYYRKKLLEAEDQLNKKVDEMKKQHFLSILPLQKEGNNIILGLRVPTDEELKDADEFLEESEKKQLKSVLKAEPIEHFWSRVLLNDPHISEICSEEDLDVLKHLIKVENEFDKDTHNFTLRFEFSDNEFFDNKVLEKKFVFEDKTDRPVKSEGTQIHWKSGKNITKKIQKKKQKNKKTGQTRLIEKEVNVPSFFQFFTNQFGDENDEQIVKEVNEQDKLQMDFEIGTSLIEEVIPSALEYYLGVQKDEGDMEGEFDEDDDDEEESDFDE